MTILFVFPFVDGLCCREMCKNYVSTIHESVAYIFVGKKPSILVTLQNEKCLFLTFFLTSVSLSLQFYIYFLTPYLHVFVCAC